MTKSDNVNAAEKILFDLGNLKKDEKLLIIADHYTKKIGNIFHSIAEKNHISSNILIIKPFNVHGEEPPKTVRDHMLNSNLILGLTTNSMAHTKARLDTKNRGIRYLSLPDYSFDVLADQSLRTDFKKSGIKAKIMAEKLTSGKKIRLITNSGTDLHLDITNREGNFCPGYVNEKILLGSPPDIEANVSPNENESTGTIVVDGSIPIKGLGKLEDKVVLKIERGSIVKIEAKSKIQSYLEELFENHGKSSKVLAELGFGYNENAMVCGNMLIDEGSYGTVHLGFGSNFTIGGTNKSNFHLDFVLYANKVIIDNQEISI